MGAIRINPIKIKIEFTNHPKPTDANNPRKSTGHSQDVRFDRSTEKMELLPRFTVISLGVIANTYILAPHIQELIEAGGKGFHAKIGQGHFPQPFAIAAAIVPLQNFYAGSGHSFWVAVRHLPPQFTIL